MSEQNTQRLHELLELKERRLHELLKQQAIHGINTPAHIALEINNLNDEIIVFKNALNPGANIVTNTGNETTTQSILKKTFLKPRSVTIVFALLIYSFILYYTVTSLITHQESSNLTPTQSVNINNKHIPLEIMTILTQASSWNPVIIDNFNTSQNWDLAKWDNQDTSGIVIIEKEDRWELQTKTVNQADYTSLPKTSKTLQNTYIQIEGLRLRGQDQQGYGIVLRGTGQPNTPEASFYCFAVNNMGSYAFFIKASQDRDYLIPWTPSEYIKSDEPNKLLVISQGSSFLLFINDSFVYKIDNTKYLQGYAGIWAEFGANDVIEFDNLKILTSD